MASDATMTPSAAGECRHHWCVAYRGADDLQAATGRHLQEGLAAGDQVGFFGWGDIDGLRPVVRALDDIDVRCADASARVGSLDEVFRRDAPPDPMERLTYWSDATESALAA